jgi:crotonobetainyl-CoA:carnitine CoA-transferase CaiB-like acyl-CoA transferase
VIDKPQTAGVRVAEFVSADSSIAAAYAGWLLARLGAEVTRLIAPPPETAPAPSNPLRLALEVLADGKGGLPCPDRAALTALLTDYDVLLCDAPRSLEAIAGSLSSLREHQPRLVISIATVLGLDGPYANFPACALDAQALSAVAWSLGEPDRTPLSLPPGIVEHQAGTMLAAGSLLALQVRDSRGNGRLVDIALADVLASYVAGNCRVYIHHGLRWHRGGRRASGSGGAYPYVILPCKDGEVCLFGRTREEWERLVQVMGSPAWAAEPRYQDLRAMGTQYPDEVDALMLPWLAQHTKAELEAIALANNLILSPIRNFAEVLQTPQFAQREFFVEGRAANHSVQTPALPFRVTESRSPNAPNLAAALLGGSAPPATPPVDSPLQGLRVLDFGWVWSAPWVGTILGELGAQVIKVEHGKRPDNLRLAGRVLRDGKKVEGPSKEMSPMYHQINHGKLGITLNLKEPRAVELLKRLAGISDLVVENMSPGSLERTHLGYDALREVNPRLVMLAMSAAGQFGPLADMRAYAPNMSSAAGLESLVGYRGEAPLGALSFGLGDPNASTHALVAVLAALRRARATGRGCYIDLSQIEALLGTLRPYLIDSQVHDRQSPVRGNTHPEMAPHGIYPACEADAWLTLATPDEAAWRALQVLANEAWARDSRFQSLAGRLAHTDDLDRAIAQWTATHPRDALVAILRAAGIASSPVLSVEEQWRDPHFAARGIKHPVNIPFYGEEDLFQAPWRFSDFAPRITACGPSLGQHNDFVLGELLGLSGDEITALQQAGVVA